MIETIKLRDFQPADQGEVKALITAGLGEHHGFVDHSMNPDLNNISKSYADTVFNVAEQAARERFLGESSNESQKRRIVGAGALIPRTGDKAEIVCMSVVPDVRRYGIGTMILHHLCEEGKARGFSQLFLETTTTWTDVIAFYQRFGFHITHTDMGELGPETYLALDI